MKKIVLITGASKGIGYALTKKMLTKNVFVIGATNRPDVLDSAIIRPGRLDQLIYIPLPDYKSRIGIFRAGLKKAPVSPDVNVEVLARSTEGFSGADIAEVCQSASKAAIREVIVSKEERRKRLERIEQGLEEEGDNGNEEDDDDYVPKEMLITKKHFNMAMSRARRSVTDKDLVLFQQFAEKNMPGSGTSKGGKKFKFDVKKGELIEETGGGVEGSLKEKGDAKSSGDDLY